MLWILNIIKDINLIMKIITWFEVHQTETIYSFANRRELCMLQAKYNKNRFHYQHIMSSHKNVKLSTARIAKKYRFLIWDWTADGHGQGIKDILLSVAKWIQIPNKIPTSCRCWPDAVVGHWSGSKSLVISDKKVAPNTFSPDTFDIVSIVTLP